MPVMVVIDDDSVHAYVDIGGKVRLPWGVPNKKRMVQLLDADGRLQPRLSERDRAALSRQMLLEDV